MSIADPNSYIEAALEELRWTLAGKNEDYRVDGEFSNFEFAANVADLDVTDVMVTQIGIKLGRILGLKSKVWTNNESLHDSVKDLAGYAVIMYAYYNYIQGDNDPAEPNVVDGNFTMEGRTDEAA